MRFVHRASIVCLCVILLAANMGVCAGWAPTADARMACCTADGGCPMHDGASSASGADRGISQAQADACCAGSERDTSSSSTSGITAIFTAVLGAGVVHPPSTPTLVLTDGWRTDAPVPTLPVPRHLLLSVLLV